MQDQLRPEAKETIQRFQAEGYQCLMLTGDRQETADYFAKELGLNGVIAEVLPEQKRRKFERCKQKEKSGDDWRWH